MTNKVKDVREQLKALVRQALDGALQAGELNGPPLADINIEVPKEKGFGDFSCNAAFQAAGLYRKAPRQIAEILLKRIAELESGFESESESGFESGSETKSKSDSRTSRTGSAGRVGRARLIDKAECAGPGFINFHLDSRWLRDAVLAAQKERREYGRSDMGRGLKTMVEFVSANPTGPLTMGNARGGSLGDCIAAVLEAMGYDVTREFYINDSGNQIEKFGQSLEARYIQQLKGKDAAVFPEDGYHGEDVTENAAQYIARYGDKLLGEGFDAVTRRKELAEFALKRNMESIKASLLKYGIEFDIWFSEQSLYDSGQIDETIEYLRSSGYTYESEGALWFKAMEFGGEKDEVIIRSNGLPTYLASDIAYHRNKFVKRGFYKAINILGADHHGHAKRFNAAVAALGVEPERFDIVLFQLVRFIRDGEITRMSKRAGKSISLDDLIEEVGRDAARFFFNMKSTGNHLDFDINLAVSQSNENPVFYVQYANARICSMMKVFASEGIAMPKAGEVDLNLLSAPEEINLMHRIAEYPEEVALAAETLEPARLTRYAVDLASDFHSFYRACRIKGAETAELMNARIILVDSVHIVLANLLDILKISAPESM